MYVCVCVCVLKRNGTEFVRPCKNTAINYPSPWVRCSLLLRLLSWFHSHRIMHCLPAQQPKKKNDGTAPHPRTTERPRLLIVCAFMKERCGEGKNKEPRQRSGRGEQDGSRGSINEMLRTKISGQHISRSSKKKKKKKKRLRWCASRSDRFAPGGQPLRSGTPWSLPYIPSVLASP